MYSNGRLLVGDPARATSHASAGAAPRARTSTAAALLLLLQASCHACCGGAAVEAPRAVRIYKYKGSAQPILIVQ
eukprot:scaffold3190_cov409-Prasinococcus_capsulatus_cf.AAC.19